MFRHTAGSSDVCKALLLKNTCCRARWSEQILVLPFLVFHIIILMMSLTAGEVTSFAEQVKGQRERRPRFLAVSDHIWVFTTPLIAKSVFHIHVSVLRILVLLIIVLNLLLTARLRKKLKRSRLRRGCTCVLLAHLTVLLGEVTRLILL